jgi:magnesium chelatase subunit I
MVLKTRLFRTGTSDSIPSQHQFIGASGQPKQIGSKDDQLLDEYIPFVTGSEINDDPLQPISRFAKDIIEAKGDETPISWCIEANVFLKTSHPDVTVADLIGDVDPIKAAI